MSQRGNPARITLPGGSKYRVSGQGNKETDDGKGTVYVTGPDIDDVTLPLKGSRRSAFTFLEPSEETSYEILLRDNGKNDYPSSQVVTTESTEDGAPVFEIQGEAEGHADPLIVVTCRPE